MQGRKVWGAVTDVSRITIYIGMWYSSAFGHSFSTCLPYGLKSISGRIEVTPQAIKDLYVDLNVNLTVSRPPSLPSIIQLGYD